MVAQHVFRLPVERRPDLGPRSQLSPVRYLPGAKLPVTPVSELYADVRGDPELLELDPEEGRHIATAEAEDTTRITTALRDPAEPRQASRPAPGPAASSPDGEQTNNDNVLIRTKVDAAARPASVAPSRSRLVLAARRGLQNRTLLEKPSTGTVGLPLAPATVETLATPTSSGPQGPRLVSGRGSLGFSQYRVQSFLRFPGSPPSRRRWVRR